MRPLARLAVASLLALGCGEPPCQELGERLCGCTGLGASDCKAQVEEQLKSADPGDSACDGYLQSCDSGAPAFPPGADFCEWLGTEKGKQACGIAAPAQ